MPALPEGWQDLTIADICDEIYDGPHATPKKLDEGPIFLSISSLVNGRLVLSESAHLSEEDFVKWTSRITPQEDDLVFSYETRLGEAALIPEGLKCCLGRRMGLIRPYREMVDPQYFLYYFLSPILQNEIRKYTTAGSTVQRLALADVRKFRVLLPPLPEQRVIASILGALDDKIELNRRMNATLESLARAIFKSWFVDFDPVKINAGQMPASSQALITPDTKVLDLFPSTFQDSELGPIPEGWTIKSIEEIAEVKSGKRLPKGHKLAESPTPFPYLRGVDVENGRFNPEDVQYLGEETQARISKYIVNTNDVVLTIVGTIGRVIFIDPQWNGANLTENAARITNIREGGSRLIFQYLSSPNGQDDIRSRIAGSVQGKLPLYQIKAIKLAIPNSSLSAEFERIAASIDDMLVRNLAESANLSRTRDDLLPQLLSGELPVPELIETEN